MWTWALRPHRCDGGQPAIVLQRHSHIRRVDAHMHATEATPTSLCDLATPAPQPDLYSPPTTSTTLTTPLMHPSPSSLQRKPWKHGTKANQEPRTKNQEPRTKNQEDGLRARGDPTADHTATVAPCRSSTVRRTTCNDTGTVTPSPRDQPWGSAAEPRRVARGAGTGLVVARVGVVTDVLREHRAHQRLHLLGVHVRGLDPIPLLHADPVDHLEGK
ncbi:hypothetical protein EYF80_028673 [Liparis tanakae]|uniref:Uncharacterized protein n=1 Tax=Liparis tanakae TaxID=230148 RepID=A0A4Z2H7F5_9TELE|nr:hypothetical protein EYF80_028673 [Liparis tanakae]